MPPLPRLVGVALVLVGVILLALVAVGTFMTALDASIVNIGLPRSRGRFARRSAGPSSG